MLLLPGSEELHIFRCGATRAAIGLLPAMERAASCVHSGAIAACLVNIRVTIALVCRCDEHPTSIGTEQLLSKLAIAFLLTKNSEPRSKRKRQTPCRQGSLPTSSICANKKPAGAYAVASSILPAMSINRLSRQTRLSPVCSFCLFLLRRQSVQHCFAAQPFLTRRSSWRPQGFRCREHMATARPVMTVSRLPPASMTSVDVEYLYSLHASCRAPYQPTINARLRDRPREKGEMLFGTRSGAGTRRAGGARRTGGARRARARTGTGAARRTACTGTLIACATFAANSRHAQCGNNQQDFRSALE